MSQFHIHVYKVPEKAELTIEADNALGARLKALEKAEKGELKFEKNDEGDYQIFTYEEG